MRTGRRSVDMEIMVFESVHEFVVIYIHISLQDAPKFVSLLIKYRIAFVTNMFITVLLTFVVTSCTFSAQRPCRWQDTI
jgi:hypothetical protein